MLLIRDLNIKKTDKICGICGICMTCLILVNMSWQVQGHFCRIIRSYESFENNVQRGVELKVCMTISTYIKV
jgi:hypothetical protein